MAKQSDVHALMVDVHSLRRDDLDGCGKLSKQALIARFH